jgi:hypothetical protein
MVRFKTQVQNVHNIRCLIEPKIIFVVGVLEITTSFFIMGQLKWIAAPALH